MPVVKPRGLKSIQSLNLEPEKMNSKIKLMIAMDIAGYTGNSIAREVGLTPSRVSIIRNSPLFIQERDAQRGLLEKKFIDKKSSQIAMGDPVKARFKDLAKEAVEKYAGLLNGAKSEFVQKATADAILDRAGYRAKTDQTTVSVEVTERMSQRFEKVLGQAVESRVKVTSRKDDE